MFSYLNNLKDISMSQYYYNICGITEEELNQKTDYNLEEISTMGADSAML